MDSGSKVQLILNARARYMPFFTFEPNYKAKGIKNSFDHRTNRCSDSKTITVSGCFSEIHRKEIDIIDIFSIIFHLGRTKRLWLPFLMG